MKAVIRFRQWMRQVLPPFEITLIAVVLVVLTEGITHWIHSLANGVQPLREFHHGRDFLLFLIAAGYGCFRVVYTHPAVGKKYRDWLMLTPWTNDKPLPLGPVYLTLQDVIVVLSIMAIGYYEPMLAIERIPLAFLVSYLVTLCYPQMTARHWGHLYLNLFALGLVILLVHHVWVAEAIALAAYAFAWFGIQKTLNNLPADSDRYTQWPGFSILGDRKREELYDPNPGWPFEMLRPLGPKWRLPFWHGVTMSFLAGWFLFVILSHAVTDLNAQFGANNANLFAEINEAANLNDEQKQQVKQRLALQQQKRMAEAYMMLYGGLILYAGLALAITRLTLYIYGHSTPIDFMGRIFTGRWIIPKYDVVFIAPLMIFVVGMGVGMLGLYLTMNPIFVAPAILTAMLLVTLTMGPRLEHWRMTAPSKLVCPHRKPNEAQVKRLQKQFEYSEI